MEAIQQSPEPRGEVTRLLQAWSAGDREAGEHLLPMIYSELRKIAAGTLAHERAHHTLQATELIHQAFLRLVGSPGASWENRAHFFAAAARTVRRLLVEHARRAGAQRRGDGLRPEPLDELAERVPDPAGRRSDDLIALDAALERLQGLDPELAQVVEYRFFAGMSGREIATVLGLSTATVQRRWRLARGFLFRDLGGAVPEP
ncbi:MAG: ECF-type sigma factor [Acidobacteriota bacterium]